MDIKEMINLFDSLKKEGTNLEHTSGEQIAKQAEKHNASIDDYGSFTQQVGQGFRNAVINPVLSLDYAITGDDTALKQSLEQTSYNPVTGHPEDNGIPGAINALSLLYFPAAVGSLSRLVAGKAIEKIENRAVKGLTDKAVTNLLEKPSLKRELIPATASQTSIATAFTANQTGLESRMNQRGDIDIPSRKEVAEMFGSNLALGVFVDELIKTGLNIKDNVKINNVLKDISREGDYAKISVPQEYNIKAPVLLFRYIKEKNGYIAEKTNNGFVLKDANGKIVSKEPLTKDSLRDISAKHPLLVLEKQGKRLKFRLTGNSQNQLLFGRSTNKLGDIKGYFDDDNIYISIKDSNVKNKKLFIKKLGSERLVKPTTLKDEDFKKTEPTPEDAKKSEDLDWIINDAQNEYIETIQNNEDFRNIVDSKISETEPTAVYDSLPKSVKELFREKYNINSKGEFENTIEVIKDNNEFKDYTYDDLLDDMINNDFSPKQQSEPTENYEAESTYGTGSSHIKEDIDIIKEEVKNNLLSKINKTESTKTGRKPKSEEFINRLINNKLNEELFSYKKLYDTNPDKFKEDTGFNSYDELVSHIQKKLRTNPEEFMDIHLNETKKNPKTKEFEYNYKGNRFNLDVSLKPELFSDIKKQYASKQNTKEFKAKQTSKRFDLRGELVGSGKDELIIENNGKIKTYSHKEPDEVFTTINDIKYGSLWKEKVKTGNKELDALLNDNFVNYAITKTKDIKKTLKAIEHRLKKLSEENIERLIKDLPKDKKEPIKNILTKRKENLELLQSLLERKSLKELNLLKAKLNDKSLIESKTSHEKHLVENYLKKYKDSLTEKHKNFDVEKIYKEKNTKNGKERYQAFKNILRERSDYLDFKIKELEKYTDKNKAKEELVGSEFEEDLKTAKSNSQKIDELKVEKELLDEILYGSEPTVEKQTLKELVKEYPELFFIRRLKRDFNKLKELFDHDKQKYNEEVKRRINSLKKEYKKLIKEREQLTNHLEDVGEIENKKDSRFTLDEEGLNKINKEIERISYELYKLEKTIKFEEPARELEQIKKDFEARNINDLEEKITTKISVGSDAKLTKETNFGTNPHKFVDFKVRDINENGKATESEVIISTKFFDESGKIKEPTKYIETITHELLHVVTKDMEQYPGIYKLERIDLISKELKPIVGSLMKNAKTKKYVKELYTMLNSERFKTLDNEEKISYIFEKLFGNEIIKNNKAIRENLNIKSNPIDLLSKLKTKLKETIKEKQDLYDLLDEASKKIADNEAEPYREALFLIDNLQRNLEKVININGHIKLAYQGIKNKKFEAYLKTDLLLDRAMSNELFQNISNMLDELTLLESFKIDRQKEVVEQIASITKGYESELTKKTQSIQDKIKSEILKESDNSIEKAKELDYHLGRAFVNGLHKLTKYLDETGSLKDFLKKIEPTEGIARKVASDIYNEFKKSDIYLSDESLLKIRDVINKGIRDIVDFKNIKAKKNIANSEVIMNKIKSIVYKDVGSEEGIIKARELFASGYKDILNEIIDVEIAKRRFTKYIKNNTGSFNKTIENLLIKKPETVKKFAEYWNTQEKISKDYGLYNQQFNANPEMSFMRYDRKIWIMTKKPKGKQYTILRTIANKDSKGKTSYMYIVAVDDPKAVIGSQESIVAEFSPKGNVTGVYEAPVLGTFKRETIYINGKKTYRYYTGKGKYKTYINLTKNMRVKPVQGKKGVYKIQYMLDSEELARFKLFGNHNSMVDLSFSRQFTRNAYLREYSRIAKRARAQELQILLKEKVFLTKEDYAKLEPTEQEKYVEVKLKDYGKYYVQRRFEHQFKGTKGINLASLKLRDKQLSYFINANVIRPLVGALKALRGVVLTYNLASYINSAVSSYLLYVTNANEPRKIYEHINNIRKDTEEYKNLLDKYSDYYIKGDFEKAKQIKKQIEDNKVHYAIENGIYTTIREDAYLVKSYQENEFTKTIRPLMKDEKAYQFIKNWWALPDSKVGNKLGSIFDKTELYPKLALFYDGLENGLSKELALQKTIMCFPNYGANLPQIVGYFDFVSPYTKWVMNYPKIVYSATNQHRTRFMMVNALFYASIYGSYALNGQSKSDEWYKDKNFAKLNDDTYYYMNSLNPYSLPYQYGMSDEFSLYGHSLWRLLFPVDVNPLTFKH